jgi:hypothetical protein
MKGKADSVVDSELAENSNSVVAAVLISSIALEDRHEHKPYD